MHALRLACASFLALIAANAPIPAQTTDSVEVREVSESTPRDKFSKTVETGKLFIENRFIEAPYHISWTSDSITLNGTVFPVISTPETVKAEASRMRRFPERQPRSFSAAAYSARQILRTLEDEYVVVVFASEEGVPFQKQFQTFRSPSTVYALYSHLLGQPLSEGRVNFDMSEEQWQQMQPLLNTLVPNVELTKSMQQFIDDLDQQEVETNQHHAAIARLDTFAYPLTIIAMVLGVYAFGHMLKWAGTTLANSEATNTPQAIRYVEVGLMLMLAMSAIDLVWTLLAAQAGAMQELNPIAAHFVKSPMQLTVFKLVATGVGCGILYVYRHRAQMQQATWWMCLVTVLLTFRWVVFDSLVN